MVSLLFPDATGQLYIAHPRGLQGHYRRPCAVRSEVESLAARLRIASPLLLNEPLSLDDRFARLKAHSRVRSSSRAPSDSLAAAVPCAPR